MRISQYFQPIKMYWIISTSLFVILMILMIMYVGRWSDAERLNDNLWEVVDPVAGMMTFITTLAIFYMQAYRAWIDSLEKRLNISFFDASQDNVTEIVRIEKAYLAGESDIRAWSQSLGGQVMGTLDFDMYWDENTSEVIYDSKEWFHQFSVKIYLTVNPFNHPEIVETKIKPFLNKKFRYSKVRGSLEELPIIWERHDIPKQNKPPDELL